MSLGWLSIGATGDINLTGLNVDTGTLYVDKTNNRVGIRTAEPSSVLQIDSATDNIYSLNPLTSNGVSIFSAVKSNPRVSPTGSTDFGGTLWINSTSPYTRNTGASVGLGGRSYNTGTGNEHMTFARVSGVQTSSSDDKRGDFVVETAYDGSLFDRLRVKSDGKIGLGVTEPSGGLHLLSDVIATGIWNSGYRRDTPDSFLTPGTSAKVPNTVYSTILAPTGASQGWLGRIDSSSGFKYINGMVANPGNGDVYVVGYFTGTINFYSDGATLAVATTFTTGDQMGFVAKYNEFGTFSWAAKFDSAGITDWGFGITLVETSGSPSNPSVFVTGPFATGGTFTAYNQGSAGTAFGTTLTNVGGGNTGFIVKYTSTGVVQAVAKVDGVGNVVPTCAAGYGTTGFYIGGYYNLTSGALNAYNSSGVITTSFAGFDTSFDTFLVKYDVNLNPQWITAIQGSSNQIIDYPTRAIAVNPSNGDLYAVGYYDATASFYNVGGSLGTSLTNPGTRAGFLVKYNTSGVVQWAAKITSNTSVVASGVSYSSAGYVYVTGDFLGTVTFRNAGDGGASTSIQQDKVTSPGTTDRLIYITQYDTSGNNLWSTKIQSSGSTPPALVAKGMMIDADSNGNAYVGFHTVVTSPVTSSTVSVYQRSPTSLTSPSTITRHTVSGGGGFIGVVCYNSDGKVLYTTKINSNDYDRVTSMDVFQRNTGDTYPRIILSGWTEGREITCTDAVGDTFRYISGLSNAGNLVAPSTSNTSFIVQFPSSSTYVLDYPGSTEGVTKKFINPTVNRAYIIPYYDPSSSVESAYTYKILEVASDSTLEVVYTGITYGWLATSSKPTFLSNSSGNIGIGTINPTNLFQVDGTMAVVGNVGIGTKSTTYQLGVYANSPNNSYASQIHQINSSSGGLYVLCSSTSAAQKALHVKTNGKDALLVNGDGSVGIGFTGSTTTISGTTNLSNVAVSGSLTVTGTISGAVPTGTIIIYAGVSAPGGWLLCDGTAYSRTTYSALFSALGGSSSTYGLGDGVNTFNVPNLKRRFPIGYDPSGGLDPSLTSLFGNFNGLGNYGGAQTHTLSIGEMPSHSHTFNMGNESGNGNSKPGPGFGNFDYAINATGGNQPHNNLPPYIVINFIIKA